MSSSPEVTCGIVMPISGCDDHHTEDHWRDVFAILSEAATAANLRPNAVWTDGDSSIIHAKILQNLFGNEVVICDASTLNHNVMLELGMRLTTKRPTVVVAEEGTKLPFDVAVIQTLFYPRSLRHAGVKIFIGHLVHELNTVVSKYLDGTYRSFLETFTFERVEPKSISIPAEELIERRLDEFGHILGRLEGHMHSITNPATNSPRPRSLRQREDGLIELFSNSGFTLGARVVHQKFGIGTIIDIEGNKLQVEFDGLGQRRVMDAFVKAHQEASS